MAVLSFVVSAVVAGSTGYFYVNRDALIEQAVKEQATEQITAVSLLIAVGGALVGGLGGPATGGGLSIVPDSCAWPLLGF